MLKYILALIMCFVQIAVASEDSPCANTDSERLAALWKIQELFSLHLSDPNLTAAKHADLLLTVVEDADTILDPYEVFIHRSDVEASDALYTSCRVTSDRCNQESSVCHVLLDGSGGSCRLFVMICG